VNQKIRDAILGEFRETSASAGHCIMADTYILHRLKPSLNPKEENEIPSTISDLASEGLIKMEKRNGLNAFVLTERGFDYIYPTDAASARTKIRQSVKDLFASMRAKVDDCIPSRAFDINIVQSLNPKEKKEIDSALGEMADEDIIRIENRSGLPVIVLTKKGFESIY
jgi:predicted transcriptional regulator